MNATDLAESGLIPDAVIRIGIRRLLRQRLDEIQIEDCEAERRSQEALLSDLRQGPIAIATDQANEQHYEVPAGFYEAALGPHLKYSCALWAEGVRSLEQAESCMLQLTCRRAGIQDGMRILELGCGWGSLSLWMARRYPRSEIIAVSNSKSQREFITARAEARGLKNLTVVTADVNTFEPAGTFDRVVSVEMFEHVRNHARLLERISQWLRPEGRLFVHIFCHRRTTYPYETEGEDNWMGRHFFTGGMMPGDHHFHHFQDHLTLDRHWRVNGMHYQKTCEAWLAKVDASRETSLKHLEEAYGEDAALWLQRWRMFFMSCAELFGHREGNEWWVSHYLFRPQGAVS